MCNRKTGLLYTLTIVTWLIPQKRVAKCVENVYYNTRLRHECGLSTRYDGKIRIPMAQCGVVCAV